LHGDLPAPETWRQAYLLEQYSDEGAIAPTARGAHAIFAGVRTLRYKYVEYWTGVRELYHLTEDPYELENIAATASARLLSGLSSLVRDLSSCSGADCRAAEETTPP
jgi:hypothetical protein